MQMLRTPQQVMVPYRDLMLLKEIASKMDAIMALLETDLADDAKVETIKKVLTYRPPKPERPVPPSTDDGTDTGTETTPDDGSETEPTTPDPSETTGGE